ncbi:MAG: WxL domain-containing protein [Clostridioides sp.]|jgi:hypothetical protein|nr:WxL domain-containing protein [Clostridioides sp.]
MKLRKLATLMTIAGITLSFAGVKSFAADQELKSQAKVVFTAPIDPDKPIIDPADPNNQPPGKPDPESPGTGGLLSIDHVSNFDFETHEIKIGQTMDFFALPQAWLEDDGTSSTKPNYVQVSDNRLTGEGWTLSVAQDGDLKTADNKILTGAQITVSNIEGVTAPSTLVQLPLVASQRIITPGVGSQIMMSAEKDKGQGTHVARFGDNTTKGSSVKLTIPNTTTVYAKTYTANLTWTLSDTPGTGTI